MSASNGAAVRLRHAALCALLFALPLSSPLASANTPPTISGTPPASIVEAHAYSFQPAASDPDHDTLRFVISNEPSWGAFSAATGRLSGTPLKTGTYGNIVICATDGTSNSCLPAFAVTVTPVPNVPPVISGTPIAVATVGSRYSFQPTGSDPDGLKFYFAITGKPSWLTFNSATGQLYGTPTAANVSTYSNIVIAVDDAYHSAHLPPFTITVSAASSLPPTAVTISWMPPTENVDDTTLTNLAGYHLYYGTSQFNLNSVVNITNPGLASYVLSNLSAATWYFALTAVNTAGVESPRSAITSAVVQ